MVRTRNSQDDFVALDELIDEITLDAFGDDEQLWAFRQAFEDEVAFPADVFVIGEPVSLLLIDYDGNERRGLTAKCRRECGSEYAVAASDVVFPKRSSGARYIAAYRKWLGLAPYPDADLEASAPRSKHKATAEDFDLNNPLELVALGVKERVIRCRLMGKDRVITFRPNRQPWKVVPGEIITVKPRKQWHYAGNPYLSGEVSSTRIEAAKLGLVPLEVKNTGVWDPKHHWEEDEYIEEWAKPIIARGPRPEYEMEQVIPGADPANPDSDPITDSVELAEAGKIVDARTKLMELCASDLRCLDAHAHLGYLAFESLPEIAILHYQVGLRIGELSLTGQFDGVLPWYNLDNRPFLRCMHGYGLCLWRLGRFQEAEQVFDRMLWLNPPDNQGARQLLQDVRKGFRWEERS